MNELNISSEDLKSHFGSIEELYKVTPQQSFSAIIKGLEGAGKTTLLCTGPKPWLIDSFDPKGTVGIELTYADEIKKGNLLIRKFWNEDFENPTEYLKWEKFHEEDKRTGFLNYFGIYAIDSFTTFLDAMANQMSKYMRRDRKVQKLAINDYLVIYDQMKSIVKTSSSFNCNFLMTAHLETYIDKITEETRTEIKGYKGLKTDIPLLFTEKYVLETEETAKGIKHILYTRAAGKFRASTQLGANGKLNDQEEPDIKKILEKTGFTYEDKPSLKEVFK